MLGLESFRSIYRREVERGLRRPATLPPVTEEDLAPLPAAVRRYLRLTGSVGRSRVRDFQARFRGAIQTRPGARWMPFVVEQTNFFDEPGRLFLIESRLFGIPFDGLHVYLGTTATMRVRVASLFTVVDARGPEMNQGETVTMLNDRCVLAPATLLDPAIRWDELDPLRVKATFANAGNTVSAELRFDAAGELTNFASDDRFRSSDGKTYERLRWTTPVREYRDYGGRRVAALGEAAWTTPEGEQPYGRYELLDIAYNVTPR